jgi:hypothetical protein
LYKGADRDSKKSDRRMTAKLYDSLLLDDLDIKILDLCMNGNGTDMSVWNLAKEIFPDVINRRQLDAKYRLIKNRLRKMSELIYYDKSNLAFEIATDRVVFGRHKFPSGMKPSLMVKSNNLWRIIQLR